MQSSSATLPNLSRPQLWSSHLAGAHERHAFEPQLWSSCPAGTRKAEGSAALPSGVQQRCPRAPTPEPGKGRRPKNRQSQRRKVVLPGCSVFSLSWPACAGAFLVPGRWFSGPAPSGSCLFFVPPDVSFYWPRASRSSSQREGRRVSAGAPTQEPALSRYPFTYVEVVFKFAVAFVFLFFFVLRLCTTTLFFMSDCYCGDLFQL